MRYFPCKWMRILAAALAIVAPGVAAAAGEYSGLRLPAVTTRDVRPAGVLRNLDVHAYGLSYHTDQEGVRGNGMDNEVNTGLGLSYTVRENWRGATFVEAGFYQDSGNGLAKLAGVGYQYKFGKRWRLGGALLGVQSENYNDGRFFVAPLPILTYDFGAVKLNATYIPRIRDFNDFAVYGFYFSLPFTH